MNFTRRNGPELLAAVVATAITGCVRLGSVPAFLVLSIGAGFRPRVLVVVGTIVFNTVRRDIPRLSVPLRNVPLLSLNLLITLTSFPL